MPSSSSYGAARRTAASPRAFRCGAPRGRPAPRGRFSGRALRPRRSRMLGCDAKSHPRGRCLPAAAARRAPAYVPASPPSARHLPCGPAGTPCLGAASSSAARALGRPVAQKPRAGNGHGRCTAGGATGSALPPGSLGTRICLSSVRSETARRRRSLRAPSAAWTRMVARIRGQWPCYRAKVFRYNRLRQ